MSQRESVDIPFSKKSLSKLNLEQDLIDYNKVTTMKNILFAFALIFTCSFSYAEELDSIKTIKEKGNSFVLHKIDKGETFYSICRKYGASPSDALKFNPQALEVIKTGEMLKIPLPIKEIVSEEIIEVADESKENVYHIVGKGETLYALSRNFRVSVEDLKKWNNFTDNSISEGQKVIVGKKIKTVIVDNSITTDSIRIMDKSENKMEVDPDLKNDPNIVVVDEGDSKSFENLPEGSEVSESGFVKFIQDEEIDQSRNYVLHPKAKVGTIIMITNPQNNKSVFARVLGPFNVAEEENQDIIMLITENTAKKIGLKGKDNLLVQLNYTK